MACDFQAILNAGFPQKGPLAAIEALERISQLEHLLSVYLPDSELSRMNRLAVCEPWPASEHVFGLLCLAKQIWKETLGAFDVTAAKLTSTWGFFSRQGRLPSNDEIAKALDECGSQHLILNFEEQTVKYAVRGLEVNSGGIGKGFALDVAAGVLDAASVDSFLVHGGKSSVIACGNRLDAITETGWKVAISHPQQPAIRLGGVRLKNKSLGTSGPAQQYFYHRGRRYGHIIDPRTGWPADGVLSVTVVTESAARADALATGLYVMGLEQSLEFCKTHPEVGMISIVSGEREGDVELWVVNLAEDEWIDEGSSKIHRIAFAPASGGDGGRVPDVNG